MQEPQAGAATTQVSTAIQLVAPLSYAGLKGQQGEQLLELQIANF